MAQSDYSFDNDCGIIIIRFRTEMVLPHCVVQQMGRAQCQKINAVREAHPAATMKSECFI
jgi:hypothetical protein